MEGFIFVGFLRGGCPRGGGNWRNPTIAPLREKGNPEDTRQRWVSDGESELPRRRRQEKAPPILTDLKLEAKLVGARAMDLLFTEATCKVHESFSGKLRWGPNVLYLAMSNVVPHKGYDHGEHKEDALTGTLTTHH